MSEKVTRNGTTIVELLVAAILLSTALTLVSQCIVRTQRLQHQSRAYRFALDELNNCMERWTLLAEAERFEEISAWKPPEPLRSAVGEVKLIAEEFPDDVGKRLRLSLHWPSEQPSAPLTIDGWISAEGTQANEEVK